jgi:hypothetical protein
MFSNPAESSGGITWSDHLGQLVLVEPDSLETGIATVHGTKEAIKGRVSFLVGPGEAEVFEDALIFGGVLIGQLKSRIGEKVLGRLAQGDAKPGQNPPWKLLDATAEDIEKATAYVTERDKPAVTSAQAPF